MSWVQDPEPWHGQPKNPSEHHGCHIETDKQAAFHVHTCKQFQITISQTVRRNRETPHRVFQPNR